jgi:hypothetical protein
VEITDDGCLEERGVVQAVTAGVLRSVRHDAAARSIDGNTSPTPSSTGWNPSERASPDAASGPSCDQRHASLTISIFLIYIMPMPESELLFTRRHVDYMRVAGSLCC